jgi:hypothetical protein
MEYLLKAQERGLVNVIIVGETTVHHGEALNRLVNGARPSTDYAVVMDNDVQILRRGWLSDLLGTARADQNIIAVVDCKPKGYWPYGFRPPIYHFWFGLINMRAYRDGMQVNWNAGFESRLEEPWLSFFADLYPPDNNPEFQDYIKRGWARKDFDDNLVLSDPGCHIWKKVTFDNPKGYRVIPLSTTQRMSFYHWGHACNWLDPALNVEGPPEPTPERPWGDFGMIKHREYVSAINAALKELRGA